MKMRVPVMLGACVTLYWVLAFATALSSVFLGPDADRQWWSLWILREPGHWLGGDVIFSGIEKIGFNYATILNDGLPYFIGALLYTAVGIGVGTWLGLQLIVSRICLARLNRSNQNSQQTSSSNGGNAPV
jgi:hypothetical protein